MIPVVPFAVLFEATVAAQAPECYSPSRIYLCGPKPPTPELSIKHLYPSDMELNADIVGMGSKEVRKPRMPPYTVRAYPKPAPRTPTVSVQNVCQAGVARTNGTASRTKQMRFKGQGIEQINTAAPEACSASAVATPAPFRNR
jgi:hypothetical protein